MDLVALESRPLLHSVWTQMLLGSLVSLQDLPARLLRRAIALGLGAQRLLFWLE